MSKYSLCPKCKIINNRERMLVRYKSLFHNDGGIETQYYVICPIHKVQLININEKCKENKL